MGELLSTKQSIEAAFFYLHKVDLSKKQWDFETFLKNETKRHKNRFSPNKTWISGKALN